MIDYQRDFVFIHGNWLELTATFLSLVVCQDAATSEYLV